MIDSEVIGMTVFFLITFFAFREFLDYRTRKNLIDKGVTPEEAVKLVKSTTRKQQSPSSLKWGLIIALVGIAMVIARIIDEVSNEVAFGLMFIAAGTGLLIYYFLSMKKFRESQKNGDNDQKPF